MYSTGSTHYAALELQHVVSLSAVTQAPEGFLGELYDRQVDLVALLMHVGDERTTVELRTISYPDEDLPTRGRIRLVLLCKRDGADPADVEDLTANVLKYLQAHFPEYRFSAVAAHDIKHILSPFEIRSGVEITRRCERVRLDTLRNESRRTKSFGFTPLNDSREFHETPTEGIVYVAPFLFTQGSFERLFKQFLLAPQQLLISTMLQPTTLTKHEAEFLEGQIASCERFSQVHLDRLPDPHDLHTVFPTLQEQAKIYQRIYAQLLSALQSSSAIMQIRIASSGEMPATIVHAIGSNLTEPTGGKGADAPEKRVWGGYELISIPSDGIPQFAGTIASMSFHFTHEVLLPVSAQRILHLYEPTNAACAFRFPPPPTESLPGVSTLQWRVNVAPSTVDAEGTLIGVSEEASIKQRVRIRPDDRRRHVYMIGQTGTGKTTLLKSMILSDIHAGQGVCVIDPHGDMFKELLGKMPEQRIKDVIVFDPTDSDFPVGLNLLECVSQSERHFVAQEMVAIITKLVEDEYGPGSVQMFTGPVFFQHMRNNLLLAMSDPDDPGTLLEYYMIYQDKNYWRRWLPLKTPDPLLERWVSQVLPRTDYTYVSRETGSMGGYVGSKFEAFIFDPLLRNIFGQKRSTLDLGKVMDEGKILLVNLAKGELTEANSRFLGLVLMAKLQAVVMERVKVSKTKRRDFNIYIDEFQNIATQNFVTLLSEGRKFRVNLTLATQFIGQVEPRIVHSILGNVGTIICFRLGQLDAELMEKEFFPRFNRYDLLNLPNWHAYVSMLVEGKTTIPFSMCTLVDDIPYDAARARACIAASRKRYGTPRHVVEAAIARSVAPARTTHNDVSPPIENFTNKV